MKVVVCAHRGLFLSITIWIEGDGPSGDCGRGGGGFLGKKTKILVIYQPEYLVLLAELCYRMVCLCW